MADPQRKNGHMSDWRQQHQSVILELLDHVNAHSGDFVLKGGTALLVCYGLDRFSEDIDFDGKPQPEKNIIALVDHFCQERKYDYRVAKNTDMVKRCMIHYGNPGNPLKVEVSYRRKEISDEEITNIRGVTGSLFLLGTSG
jgi:predicted nucleotidyltransferase component of viral defense system